MRDYSKKIVVFVSCFLLSYFGFAQTQQELKHVQENGGNHRFENGLRINTVNENNNTPLQILKDFSNLDYNIFSSDCRLLPQVPNVPNVHKNAMLRLNYNETDLDSLDIANDERTLKSTSNSKSQVVIDITPNLHYINLDKEKSSLILDNKDNDEKGNQKAPTSIYSDDFETGFSADGLLETTSTAGWYSSIQPVNCSRNYWGVYSYGGYNISGRSLMIVAVDGACTFYPGQYHINYATSIDAYVTVDASGFEGIDLEFDWRSNGEIYNGTYYDYGQVLYRAGTSGTWQILNTGGNDGLGKYAGQSSVQAANLSLPALLDDGVFQIGFRWQNDNVDGSWESFVVDNILITGTAIVVGDPPTCTSPIMPANNSTGHSPGDALSWNTVSDASSYDVYFGTSSNPSFVTNIVGTTYVPTLADNTTYYWKIVPKNAFGSASGCEIWTFVSGTGPVSGDYRTRYLTGPYGWNNSDNWEVYNGSNWVVASSLPTAANNVHIQENSQYVVLNTPLTSAGAHCKVNNLRIDGTLQIWNGLDAVTDAYGDLDIYGDLNVMTTGVLETFVNVLNIEAVSMINIFGGNLNNYGRMTLYAETNISSYTYALINFYGNTTSDLNLQSGSTTRFFYVQIAKDNADDIVNININEEFLASNDEWAGNNGFLRSYNSNSWDETPKGHVVIGGSYSKDNPVWFQGLNTFSLAFNTSNGVSSNLTVEIDNPNFGVMAQDVDFYLEGSLLINQGQTDIGATSGVVIGVDVCEYSLIISDGGSLTVNGGALMTRAGIIGNGTNSFNMTGGSVYVGMNANDTWRGLFDLQGTPQVAISGGQITLSEYQYVNVNVGYRVDDGNINITGGTLNLGSTYSPTEVITFSIQGHTPSISLYTDAGSTFANAIMWEDVHCYGDIDIPVDCAFSIYDQDNGDIPYNLSLTGNLTHLGGIYAEQENSKIIFNGTSTQIFNSTGTYSSLNGIAGISLLEINNSAGVNLEGNGTTITKNLNQIDGTFNIGSTELTLIGNITRTNGDFGGTNESELSILGEGELGNMFFNASSDSLKIINLNRINSGTAFLASNIEVGESINFTNGVFYTYLDGSSANEIDTLYLAQDAQLLNENNTSHIYGAVSISNNITMQTVINSPEPFDSDFLVHGFSAPTTVWFAPDSHTEIDHLPTGGCPDGRIGYSGNWNNYWGNFVRPPETNCTGYDNVVMSFDVSHSYFASHPDDWLRFYMWADGGYENNIVSVKINGVDVTHDAGVNGKGFKFTEIRSCASVEVLFDISAIVDKSDILFYLEAHCEYNNSNVYYVYFDNIGISGVSTTPTDFDFGNVWAIMENVNTNLGDVTITRITGLDGAVDIDGNESIMCYWDINVENQPTSTVDMTFKWLDLFDNSLALTDLSVWKQDGVSPWSEQCESLEVSGNPRIINATADSFSRWSITEKGTLLPVKWTEIICNCENEELWLNWQTASEINSDYFEIEYSVDAINFTKIGKIKAAGNSNVLYDYTFIYTPSYSANHYLRLKQFDVNGQFMYSNIISSSCNIEDVIIDVFPNPFDGNLLSVQVNHNIEDVQIEVFDVAGHLVYLKDISEIDGDFTIDFAEKLTEGMYVIIIKNRTSNILLVDKLIVN